MDTFFAEEERRIARSLVERKSEAVLVKGDYVDWLYVPPVTSEAEAMRHIAEFCAEGTDKNSVIRIMSVAVAALVIGAKTSQGELVSEC